MKAMMLALILISPLAHAGSWSHVHRESAGIRVDLDYIVNYFESHDYKPANRYTAAPFYVNVSGAGLTGSQSVRVVINSYQGIPYTPGFQPVPITYTLDLRWTGDHYSGEITDADVNQAYYSYGKGRNWPFLIRTTGYGGEMPTRQDMAVVIDGRWIKNGDRNFDLNLFDER